MSEVQTQITLHPLTGLSPRDEDTIAWHAVDAVLEQLQHRGLIRQNGSPKHAAEDSITLAVHDAVLHTLRARRPNGVNS